MPEYRHEAPDDCRPTDERVKELELVLDKLAAAMAEADTYDKSMGCPPSAALSRDRLTRWQGYINEVL